MVSYVNTLLIIASISSGKTSSPEAKEIIAWEKIETWSLTKSSFDNRGASFLTFLGDLKLGDFSILLLQFLAQFSYSKAEKQFLVLVN